jgi:electron transport complex protein RnfG
MVKLGVILALYAAAACMGLAFVYTGTASIIERRAKADQEAALKALFSDADSFLPLEDAVQSGDPRVRFESPRVAMKDGRVAGLAVQTLRASYSGDIRVLVGVNTGGRIQGVKILANSDTPGLGANAGADNYYIDRARGLRFFDQFAGKGVGDPFEPKNDVVAITAATITSRAVADSVKAAGLAASAWLAAHAGNESPVPPGGAE